MRAVDLIYDGVKLSELGYFICDFSSSSSADSITAGSELTFTTVPMHHGTINPLVTSKYEQVYAVDFYIAKDVDTAADAYLSMEDVSMLMKWLVRKDYHELVLIGDKRDPYVHDVRFRGSFTAKMMSFTDRIIGMELSFTSDRPFGYLYPITQTGTISAGGSFEITPSTDELGFIYPDQLIITINEDGNLNITNDQDPERYTYIANCTNGEVITMDCVHQVIQSSYNAHGTLYNDFNFNFFRLVSTSVCDTNVISPSIACTMQLTYTPVCKAVF